MSNKRINLTQFEGITEGKWQWFTGDGKKGLALFPSVEENDDILLWDESDPLAANQYTANANAIAAVPDLIAELKRCYAREDELLDALRIVKEDLDDALENEGYESLAHEKSNRTLQKIRNFANDASE